MIKQLVAIDPQCLTSAKSGFEEITGLTILGNKPEEAIFNV